MARRRRDSGDSRETQDDDLIEDEQMDSEDSPFVAPVAAAPVARAARPSRTARIGRMTVGEFARTLGALGKAFVSENSDTPQRRTKAEWQDRYDKFLTAPR